MLYGLPSTVASFRQFGGDNGGVVLHWEVNERDPTRIALKLCISWDDGAD